jgi:Tol biopolymer transport system component
MPRRLTHAKHVFCGHVAWTPSGSEILFTTGWDIGIHRASLAGGEPQPVLGVGAGYPSIRKDFVVYQRLTSFPLEIWRAGGRSASTRNREPRKLIASGRDDANPAYSPDGRRIAFSSLRGGAENIWACDSDGRNAVQLTNLKGHAGTPRWSPDGRKLVFDSIEAGDWNLYVVDADGGPPQRLTPQSSDENVGAWSRDGRWVYFQTNRSGSKQIWKMPSAGGPAVQVTRGGGYYAEESWDGRHLYYTKAQGPAGIWRVPVAGGDETEVLRGPVTRWGDWALSRSGLYYATSRLRGRESEYAVQFLDFESGRTTELLRQVGSSGHQWLAVSPDEESLLYGEEQRTQSELMLVENFR